MNKNRAGERHKFGKCFTKIFARILKIAVQTEEYHR